MKKVLTIAGSDSSGGAGIQADLKTFAANGVYGASVITAVTAQNTKRVYNIQGIKPEIVQNQIEAVLDDIKIDAIKIGMVFNESIIHAIYNTLIKYDIQKIVLDPVMVSTSGKRLLDKKAENSLVEYLFKLAYVITPNIPEAEALTNKDIVNTEDMKEACLIIKESGVKSVLLKGGHLNKKAIDVLLHNDKFYYFEKEKINTNNTHGTGCTLSSAIASNLAKGYKLTDAVGKAKDYLTNAISNSYSVGKGNGPVNHFFEMRIEN